MESTRVKKPFFISHILIFINVLIYAFMLIFEMNFTADFSSSLLIRFGSKVGCLIADGEFYRLLTPMFLHANLLHLVFNCMALHALGPDIELLFGRKKFLFIYFLSGIFGTFSSFFFSNSYSVGASGAIFGLVGANLYFLISNPQTYKQLYGNQMLFLLGINLAYGFFNSHIDNAGHLGGMLGGHLLAWSVGTRSESLRRIKAHIAQILIVSILFWGFFWGIPYYKNTWNYNFSKGVLLIEQNDLYGAHSQFKKGLEKSPENPLLLQWLAWTERFSSN